MSYKKVISRIDLEILNKILFPKSQLIIVFDPLNISNGLNGESIVTFQEKEKLELFFHELETTFTFVNFSNESLSRLENHSFLAGQFDFLKKNNNTFTKYYYINNPDGTMRWVFPKNNSSACFLNLYNSSGWKGKLFVNAVKVLNYFNFLKPVIDGAFSVSFKSEKDFRSSFDGIHFDDFAIFTGTIGENRKAIVALSKNKKCTHFAKNPLTKASKDLVINENEKLNHLNKFNFIDTEIPTVFFKDSNLVVSNVLPQQKNKNQNWSKAHWDSLSELYNISYRKKVLSTTPFWQSIEAGRNSILNSDLIDNGLELEVIDKMKNTIDKLFSNIDSSKLISVGIGHGDFTPWNMYVGKNKLHIYDWEMSQFDFPILFDFFHYFFQKGILIDRQQSPIIQKILQAHLKDETARHILKDFKVNWEEHFQLYLLYIVTYYLPKYIAQPKLHMQVHWLIDTWLEALEYINEKSRSKSYA